MILFAATKRLNGRQIVVHFVAAWPFIYAFNLLAYLTDLSLFKMLAPDKKPDFLQTLEDSKIPMDELTRYFFYLNTGWFWGLCIAFSISLGITLKKRWFWLNPIIAYFLAYGIFKNPLNIGGWHTTIYLRTMPWSIFWFLTAGLLSLAAGCWLFFSKKVNEFITKAA